MPRKPCSGLYTHPFGKLHTRTRHGLWAIINDIARRGSCGTLVDASARSTAVFMDKPCTEANERKVTAVVHGHTIRCLPRRCIFDNTGNALGSAARVDCLIPRFTTTQRGDVFVLDGQARY